MYVSRGAAQSALRDVLSGAAPAPEDPQGLADLAAVAGARQYRRLADVVGESAMVGTTHTLDDRAAQPHSVPAPVKPARAVSARAVPVPDQVRAAYQALAGEAGDWVSLTQVRARLADGLDRQAVDEVLAQMGRTPGVHLVPETAQFNLTPADRAAAVRIGGRDQHLIRVDDVYPGGVL